MKISKTLLDSFEVFLELVPARRVNQFIRKLLICYLLTEVEGGVETNFTDQIKDMANLFDFLDTIEQAALHKEDS